MDPNPSIQPKDNIRQKNLDEERNCSVEELLGQTGRQLIETLDNLQDGLFALNKDWVFIYLNKRAAGIINLRPLDIVGKNIWVSFPQVDGTPLGHTYRLAMKEQKVKHLETQDAAKKIWLDVTVYPSKDGIIVQWRDMTERKKAEEELKSSEIALKEAQAVSHLGSWSWDLKTGEAEWSDEMYWVYGVDPSSFKITIENTRKLVFAGDRELVGRLQKQVLEEGIPASFDHRIVLPNGELRWVHIQTKQLDPKKPSRIFGTVQDITEHKKTEEMLRQSEERFSKAFGSSPAVLTITCAEDNTLVDVNASFLKVSEYAREEVIGHTTRELGLFVNQDERDRLFTIALKQGEVRNRELVLRSKTGKLLDVLFSLEPIEIGGRKHVLATIIDITDRKNAEQALIESNKNYYALFANMVDGFAYCQIVLDDKGKPIDFVYLQVNDAFERLTGLKRESVLGRRISEAIPGTKEANPEIFDVYGRVALTGIPERFEVYFKPLSRWLDISVYSPKKGYFVAIFDNITQRKKAEEDLRKSEQQFLALVKAGSSGSNVVYRMNADWTEMRTLQGQNFLADTTEPNKEWLTKYIPDKDKATVRQTINKAIETKSIFELEHQVIQADGSVGWTHSRAIPLFDKNGKLVEWLGVASNITARKKAELSVEETKERYDLLFNSVTEGFALYKGVYDDNGNLCDLRVLEINPAGASQSGVSREEQIGKTWREAFPGVTEYLFDVYRQVEREGKPFNFEHFNPLTKRWYVTTIFKVTAKQFVATFFDITDRKKAEEAIQRQADLIDLSPDAIIVRAVDGTITFWSNGAEKMYGWSKEEAIGQDINKLLRTESKKPLEEIIHQLELSGSWSSELTHYTKDGQLLVLQTYWLGRLDNNRRLTEIYESNVDVTERNILQEKLEDEATLVEEYANHMEQLANQRLTELRTSERLAAIGQTAGMVGHDIRNPLQAISGDLYLIEQELNSKPYCSSQDIAESLSSINENVSYINKIVSDLQDYTKELKPSPQAITIKDCIQYMIENRKYPDNIVVEAAVPANIALATDSTYFRRIIENLINNAVQAMPQGGELTIRAIENKGGVKITIRDTGVGIKEQDKPNVFRPLFTTKAKGQGLGLAVVKRLVEALGGSITFESQVGKGTVFSVELPQYPASRSRSMGT